MVPDGHFLSYRATTNVLLLVLTTVVAAGVVANGDVPGGLGNVADLVLVGAMFGPVFVLPLAFAARRDPSG